MTPQPDQWANSHADPASIRLLVTDVDGVLTDGSITYDTQGNELKTFHVRDGLAVKIWHRVGHTCAILTGRGGIALHKRASELGINHLIEQSRDKAADLATLCTTTNIPLAQCAYIGDDWPDLPALRSCAYPIAPADAHPDILKAAAYITPARGGRGCLRQAVEHLLSAQNTLSQAKSFYDVHHA